MIKSGESYELFYSHWGANVIDRDLFWGPDAAFDFISGQGRSDSWMDDVWCEGGALLDLDAKRLLLFGGEDILFDPFLREGYLSLCRLSWSPWTVEWAHRGIRDLAGPVGLAEDEVLAAPKKPRLRPPTFSHPKKLRNCSMLQVDQSFYAVVEDIKFYLPLGPEILNALPKRPPKLALEQEYPYGGAVIDTANRRLRYWKLNDRPRFEEEVEQGWQSWDVERDESLSASKVRELLSVAGADCPTQKQIVERVEDLVLQTIGSRALDEESVRRIHGQDAQIEINPLATVDHRPALEGESQRSHFLSLVHRLGLTDYELRG